MEYSQTNYYLELRTISDNDETFLRQLYASTRMDEFNEANWDATQIEALMRMQFDAQNSQYRSAYPNGDFQVILSSGNSIGRIYTNIDDSGLHLIDIALLPSWRGCGVGSFYLRRLTDYCDKEQLPFTLNVATANPAYQLYLRHGFQAKSNDQMQIHMRREPSTAMC